VIRTRPSEQRGRNSGLPAQSGRALFLAQVSEGDWQRQVLVWAKRANWTCYHTFDSRFSAAGFPDIVAVKPPRVLFIELKTATGKPTAAQQAWLDALTACAAVETYLWRPSDEDLVKRVLGA